MPLIDVNSLLVKYGLLCHSFAFNDLPENIKDKLGDHSRTRFQDSYLSLIANAGPRFWVELKARQPDWGNNEEALNNPVDYFSALLTKQLLQLTDLSTNAELLYPGKGSPPLILLGQLANWSTPSPLGLGLHSHYGPWFAYRALVKTTSPLQTQISIIEKVANSPCLSCESIACVSACPGNAVSIDASFNISQCAKYRLKENSSCKKKCHARNACPVGLEYQYSEEQSAYHMTYALQALVNWAKSH